MSEEKKDLKIKLKDDKGKYYEVISTEQFNIQEELNKEIEINIKYKEVLDKIKENTERTIEIIEQQPTEDDTWILERLNSNLKILEEIE